MGTFWEELGEKIGMTAEMVNNKAEEVVGLVGAKAGEAVELQKLKNQIRTLEKSNENDLTDLGRLVYEKFKGGEVLDDEAVGLCEAIQNREASIAEYQQKVSDVKGDVLCERCGKVLAKGMTYCPYCGEKAPEPSAEETEDEDTPEDTTEKTAETQDADFWSAVEDAVDRTADTVEDMADKAADKVEDAAEEAADKAEELVEKAADKAEELAEKAADKAEELAEGAQEAVKDTLEHAE